MACLALWSWLAAANVVGFAAVALDKRRARRAGPRVPELALHALALVGGWVGGLLAMTIVRHKTRKPAFLAPFFFAALLNAAAVLFLLDVLGCIALG